MTTSPGRRMDLKLAAVTAGRDTRDDFVLADAKDADMAFGVRTAGPLPGAGAAGDGAGARPGRFRTRPQYLDAMRALVAQDEIDVLLTSASNGERLAREGTLERSAITLAVRGNDTTDIWNARGGHYPGQPSRPFRTARLDAVRAFCDLVLYSVTFNDDVERDLATVEAYRAFRAEARDLGLRHFLEVFNPNASALAPADVGAFVNDSILRTLAAVTTDEAPLFLKVAYNGGPALAELVEHDPSLVVGVLGGSAGTTRDTFELLDRARHHGARVALFGRKIQHAESQLDLVRHMRAVLRGDLAPADAVRGYHDALREAGREPARDLAADLEVTDPVLRAE